MIFNELTAEWHGLNTRNEDREQCGNFAIQALSKVVDAIVNSLAEGSVERSPIPGTWE